MNYADAWADDDILEHAVTFGEAVKINLMALVEKADAARAQGLGETFFRRILSLEAALLNDLLPQGIVREILAAPDMQDSIGTSQDLFSGFEVELERSLIAVQRSMTDALGLLRHSEDFAHNYLARYRHLAERECRLAGVSRSDRVVFVGAGPFPITVIEYARISGCRAVGVEILETAAATAREVIADFAAGDRVSIVCVPGQELDFAGYSVIFVGVLAEPKDEIMARIARTRDPGSRVLCRTTHDLRRLIYRPTPAARLFPFEEHRADIACGYQTLSTLLLREMLP